MSNKHPLVSVHRFYVAKGIMKSIYKKIYILISLLRLRLYIP